MFADERSSRGVVVVRLLLVVVVSVALVTLGRQTAPDPPVRQVAGVPVGFSRTPAGARAAASTYATARARAILQAPTRRQAVLEAIGTRSFAAGVQRQERARDLAPLAVHEEADYLVAVLGSRVEVFTEGRARLTVWLVQVLAADTAAGSFLTQTVDLAWIDGDWRLDRQVDARRQAVPEITQTPRFTDTRHLVPGLRSPAYGRP
ncbi:MAG: hypothetical protein AB7G37_10780 [Solirubrobacteraceae bacterium]